MNFRKLLDWRKVLIYTHRWMGIVGGLVFIAWFVSGIVFTYKTMPTFSNAERFSHLKPLDLSQAGIEPEEAELRGGAKATSIKLAMYYDGRPVYRFAGNVTVYADTGERVGGKSKEQAAEFVRQLEPEHAASVRYMYSLDRSDMWTGGNGVVSQMPLHKVEVGDSKGTTYYISSKTGDPVMKTDRMSRFWGFLGPVLHQWYFAGLRRNSTLWDRSIFWACITGSVMALSGLVIGIWRFSPFSRFRLKGVSAHSPYSRWMKWHHYAGLIFGLTSLTWIFSGGLAFDSFGIGSSTNPTAEQRDAATGGPLKLRGMRLEDLKNALAQIHKEFSPKEVDVLQFRGEPYLLAADGAVDRPVIGLTEREFRPNPAKYRMVWLNHPERGTFQKFDHDVMMDVARDAMPEDTIREAEWLKEYDNYYRSRLGGQPLPVLRVKYADPNNTWLYIDPHRGSVVWREEDPSRRRRWLYNGLHKFDVPVIYSYRPLWDISIIVMSLGGLALSVTTIMPALRRLRRHARF